MIDRSSIIVTSLGRTGTKFFSFLFKEIIPDCSSFHEPDIVQYFGTNDRIKPFLAQVKDAGIYNMIFLKSLGRWSLIQVSDARLRGSLSEADAIKKVLKQRINFINSKPGKVYVESNAGYYGLIPILMKVYKFHRAIYIIRDGRGWVSSAMKVEELYGKKGLRKLFAHKMPSAAEFPTDPLSERWHTISRFEKLCWAWSKLNRYALSTLPENPHARTFRFEDIFLKKEKYEVLQDVVTFATDLPDIDPKQIGKIDGWLDRKIHESSNEVPGWEHWTTAQKNQFEQICGPLMNELGYAF
jgi:hypothetical protein